MGHQINQPKAPRRGSMQFYPRVRAKRIYPKIKTWPKVNETKLLGFAGYKVGMAHIMAVDEKKTSPTHGQTISIPVTILDIPKIKVAAIRFYGTDKFKTKKVVDEIWADELDKDLKRKIRLPKNKKEKKEPQDFVDVTLLVYTLPRGRVGKKKPEIFELAIGGDLNKKLEYAKNFLGKEISVKDIFKEGDVIDIVSVTKGKGFQGPIKRFGARLESIKSDRGRRMISPIGEDVPRKSNWRVPMPGQMGFHTRTEKNKQILKIGENLNEVFHHYGKIKGEYMIIKGSIPGPKKRLIRMKLSRFQNKKFEGKIERLVI